MSLENFLRLSEALHVPLPFLLNEQKKDILEIELISCVLEGRSDKQRRYLLHMLQEMAKEMDELSNI